MNRKALDAVLAAEKSYLLANGWEQVGDDDWDEPHEKGRTLCFGHAVNSQKKRDHDELRFAHLRTNPPRKVRVGQVWGIEDETIEVADITADYGFDQDGRQITLDRQGHPMVYWANNERWRGLCGPGPGGWFLIYDPEEEPA